MMAIPEIVYPQEEQLYTCELDKCPSCGERLELRSFLQSKKRVQTLPETLCMAHQTKQCQNPTCPGAGIVWPSSRWQQIAPHGISYGYDVVAQIGWWRQGEKAQFAQIHQWLPGQVQISESNVRRLYYKLYLPLIACQERRSYAKLEAVAQQGGLVLQTDGLAPEGGEAQLWFVRELQTGLCLRSGWLGKQDEQTFVNFLQPIAELELPVSFILSDKQRGLVPAISRVFGEEKHAYCQAHYLSNLAEPIAEKDSEMKVALRKMVRQEIGDIVREEAVEAPGVLTVTGMVASPIEKEGEEVIAANPSVVTEAESVDAYQTNTSATAEEKIMGRVASANLTRREETEMAIVADMNGAGAKSIVEGALSAPVTSTCLGFRCGQLRPYQRETGAEITRFSLSTVETSGKYSGFGCDEEQGPSTKPETERERGTTTAVDREVRVEETEKAREEIVQEIRRRVRYLLTLKGRPPFRLAGLEMYRGLQALVVVLDQMLTHYPDPSLTRIDQALSQALAHFSTDFQLLTQAEFWLQQIDFILDPDRNPSRNGDAVKQELTDFLKTITGGEDVWLNKIKAHLLKKTDSYASGLFHTYDHPALPRTNNDIESAFRDIQRRLLSTTGQKGLTKRLLHRYGAWELLSCPDTLPELIRALSNVPYQEWKDERQRFEQHQLRFRMHTRSPTRAKKQLDKLVERWCSLE